MNWEKTASGCALALGLLGAPIWLGVFFGLGPDDPPLTWALARILLIAVAILVLGGFANLIRIDILQRARERQNPPPSN